MSQITELARGQITQSPHNTISVELVEPDDGDRPHNVAAAAHRYRPHTVRRNGGRPGEDVQRGSRRVGRDPSEAAAMRGVVENRTAVRSVGVLALAETQQLRADIRQVLTDLAVLEQRLDALEERLDKIIEDQPEPRLSRSDHRGARAIAAAQPTTADQPRRRLVAGER